MATIDYYINELDEKTGKIIEYCIKIMIYECDECYASNEVESIPKSKLVICGKCNAINLLEEE